MSAAKRKPPPWLDLSSPQSDRPRTQLCPWCKAPILRALVGHVAASDVRADPKPLTLEQELAARLQGRFTYCLRLHPHLPAAAHPPQPRTHPRRPLPTPCRRRPPLHTETGTRRTPHRNRTQPTLLKEHTAMTIQLEPPDFLTRTARPLPCTAHPDLFHMPDEGRQDVNERKSERIRIAVDLCLGCPLMLECRDWGRSNRQMGIWGAETDEEREQAGFGRLPEPGENKPECGTEAGAKWHRRYGSGKPCVNCGHAENEAWRRRRKENDRKLEQQWPPHLAPKERAVLEALAEGIDRKQIAKRLGLGRKTVDKHLYKLRKKLRTDSEGLVAAGRELGFVNQPTTDLVQAA